MSVKKEQKSLEITRWGTEQGSQSWVTIYKPRVTKQESQVNSQVTQVTQCVSQRSKVTNQESQGQGMHHKSQTRSHNSQISSHGCSFFNSVVTNSVTTNATSWPTTHNATKMHTNLLLFLWLVPEKGICSSRSSGGGGRSGLGEPLSYSLQKKNIVLLIPECKYLITKRNS